MPDIEVDLPGGVKVTLPEEQAKAVIAGRDKLKAENAHLATEAGKARAEKEAAEKAAQAAADAKAAAEAMKAGEVEKAKELLTKSHREREDRLAARLRREALTAKVRALPNVVPEAVDDIVDHLQKSVMFDIDSSALVPLDAAGQPAKDEKGQPLGADAFVAGFLGTRKYYQRDTTAQGTGAKSAESAGGKAMKSDDFMGLSPRERAAFINGGGTVV